MALLFLLVYDIKLARILRVFPGDVALYKHKLRRLINRQRAVSLQQLNVLS